MSFQRRFIFLIPLVITIIFMVAHRNHMRLEARGVHVWRQCNTLAVARNYFQEDMNILRPRVDHRKGTNGVTGMAFPLYEYVLASTYKLFGFSPFAHRFLQLLLFALLICSGFYLALELFNDNVLAASMVVWVLAWSPELYYHGINALPDISALAFATTALWMFFRFKRKHKVLYLALCFTFISIAGLIKLQYLMFGGVLVIFGWGSRFKDIPWNMVRLTLLAAIPVFAWYGYAIWLRSVTDLKDFGLFINPADNITSALKILKANIISDLPEQLLGYFLLPACIIGVYVLFVRASNSLKYKVLFILIGLILFHLIELDQMKYHAYYMMPYILFLALSCGYGVKWVMDQQSSNVKWILMGFLGVAMFQPILTSIRMNDRFENDKKTSLPLEFNDPKQLGELRTMINQSSKTLVYPDQTGCVFFYFLQCKGWSFPNTEKLSFEQLVKKVKELKLEELVLYKSDISDNELVKIGYLERVGDFSVVHLY